MLEPSVVPLVARELRRGQLEIGRREAKNFLFVVRGRAAGFASVVIVVISAAVILILVLLFRMIRRRDDGSIGVELARVRDGTFIRTPIREIVIVTAVVLLLLLGSNLGASSSWSPGPSSVPSTAGPSLATEATSAPSPGASESMQKEDSRLPAPYRPSRRQCDDWMMMLVVTEMVSGSSQSVGVLHPNEPDFAVGGPLVLYQLKRHQLQ